MTATGVAAAPSELRLPCLPDAALPADRLATAPPELRGIARDGVRMMVAEPGHPLAHLHARDLATVLRPDDLLVRNISDTLPAALTGVAPGGVPVQVHLSTVQPGTSPDQALQDRASLWTVEIRIPEPPASRENDEPRQGQLIRLRGGGVLRVIDSSPGGRERSRLWLAELRTPLPLRRWLGEHGQPIRYGYVSGAWPLSSYRTPHGEVPGSVEMPSAGRALTPRLIRRLRLRGVRIADLVLHCGVSSGDSGDPPYAEWFSVPAGTAHAVRETRRRGGRVIAVGTTVVRALESTVDTSGDTNGASGWTDLVIRPDHAVSTVDGLLTGWHEPRASHLMMLRALAGSDLLCDSYAAALAGGYRWHEFGDLHLVLPAAA